MRLSGAQARVGQSKLLSSDATQPGEPRRDTHQRKATAEPSMNLQSHLWASPPSGSDGDPGELTRMHLRLAGYLAIGGQLRAEPRPGSLSPCPRIRPIRLPEKVRQVHLLDLTEVIDRKRDRSNVS